MTVGGRRAGLLLLVAALVLGVDAGSKALVVARLSGHPPLRTLGGAVYLLVWRNSGAAFGIATGWTAVFTLVALAIVVVIVKVSARLRSSPWAVSLGLILGGACGNLADRLARAPGVGRGAVVDWISLFSPDGRVWPVFNIADAGIVCGGVLAVLLVLLGRDVDGRLRRDSTGTRSLAPTASGEPDESGSGQADGDPSHPDAGEPAEPGSHATALIRPGATPGRRIPGHA